ncbi:hypothetical protein ABEH22_09860 [Pantoea agglomerans]|jgi:hypothetical protein|uniref:DUF6896 domain-containing protein n=1 Tax=Pantoea TaxID=53335 RepID=UPI000450BF1E|nr:MULTISPECIES: hypothetical protein [Pantoea]EZI31189.1 hypothetical protein BW31_04955 [Pantoea agglomerans]MDQ0548265.1 hypothetical protein [Pantoea agglomerans]MRT08864.1 hypothetical protein [Pantoea agglomerans]OQV41609.1 hypothetical protein BZ160_07405 [Pantoea vagans]WRO91600.1 hypothetical protein U9K49_07560 [Pantoea agglomerans]
MINQIEVIHFIELQITLMRSFFIHYPLVKDFKWLLDFPSKGVILVGNESWDFKKHGKGIRFFKNNSSAGVVVDIIDNVNNAKIIDVWRLSQYFSNHTDDEIKSTLDEMASSGFLQKISERQYEFITS